ncbi:PilW family protein [Massilia sp. Leaf139]|uniref:PilW family protein n=1 Tax=Massilia sp. Leaf139 TaxID=1736272 RepID=UPI0006FF4124|nr:PilW family protein [Massilia sp. Leaf139]KQQ97069.1 pilus assembly protein PilW [Massilia sp. Leaf139]
MRMTRMHARGFSVVELLVSVAIGLLALIFATRLITGSESSKQSALGGSDSMQNGMLAMFSISGDAQQAGFGLNDPILVGCNTRFADNAGYMLAQAPRGAGTARPLAPAIIESNGSAPDLISLYSGSSLTGTGTLRVVTDYIGGTRLNTDRQAYGFKEGDVVVVAPEDRTDDCALAQISRTPGTETFVMVAGGANFRYNRGELGTNFKGSKARVFNLGPAASLSLHTWSVNNGFLRLRATDMAGAGAAPATVADNIVSIKAQYGFDTRTGSAFANRTGLRVGSWSPTMIDADADGVTGSAGDYEHIAALRIAVVARSKTRERPAAGRTCTSTASRPTVFASAEPAGVAPVSMAVDVAVANDSTDWRCYRYRVFETVVALRNADWKP